LQAPLPRLTLLNVTLPPNAPSHFLELWNPASQDPGAAQSAAPLGVVLALSGGFARGFAHLGVLDVLEHARIPVSAIVGTSIGAVLGAAYAGGCTVEELCSLARGIRMRDLLHGQGSGRDLLGRLLGQCLRVERIEQLHIPLAVVATEVNTGAPHTFTDGPLEIALRASCAFPGLFKPVQYRGHTFVDGCIACSVPAEIAARMNAACVLGVAVQIEREEFARERGNRKRRNVQDRKAAPDSGWAAHADIVLHPPVQHLNWADFSRVDEAVEAGARAMHEALPRVHHLLYRRSPLPVPATQSGRVNPDGLR